MTLPRNFPGLVNERRRRALERITAQLRLGTKTAKRSHPFHRRNNPLTDADRLRLNAEGDALALRIQAPDIARAVRTKKNRTGTGKLTRFE